MRQLVGGVEFGVLVVPGELERREGVVGLSKPQQRREEARR